MKKIGLTQRVEIVEGYVERRDCLDQQWATFVEVLPAVPLPLPNTFSCPEALLLNLDLDGIILTGGNTLSEYASASEAAAPERDSFEKELLVTCAKKGVPVIGVCRGMQLLNHHFGGALIGVEGHTAVRHPVEPISVGGCLPLPDSLEVNSCHDFGIDLESLAPVLEVLALGPHGSIEALGHKSLPLWGVMWHPEREVPFAESDLSFFRNAFSLP